MAEPARELWRCIAEPVVWYGSGPGPRRLRWREPRVPEYASEVEGMVATMVERFQALDAEWESAVPTVDRARAYWDGRLDIRHDYLEAVSALDPPIAVEDLHASALDVFGRITAADEALAARVATLDTITEHWQWVDMPEGRAADAVLDEVFAFCRASQERFDDTQDGETFGVGPWLDPVVEQEVKVAFGCPAP